MNIYTPFFAVKFSFFFFYSFLNLKLKILKIQVLYLENIRKH